MNILIPFNSQYLTERYNMNSDFLEQLSSEVLPHILNRFSSDERVESIEIITDLGLERVCEPYSKTVLTRADIGPLQDSNEVVKALLAVRKVRSAIVVQANLLYPFMNINSLHQGYLQVKRRVVSSALGSSVNIASESNLGVITKSDLGIFTVYRESAVKRSRNRVCPPAQMIGIKALEMISLRSKIDIDLYELVINSGFEL